jgi:anaerobic nitric oxide reductase transcription regulator
LLCQDKVLVPAAISGLPREIFGRHFVAGEHPRLDAILHSRHAVIFAADDERPDPYDGMLFDPETHQTHAVHSCMGARLTVGDDVIGVLTADAMGEGKFTPAIVERFHFFSALAAAALRVGKQMEELRDKANKSSELVTSLAGASSVEFVGQSPLIRRLDEEIRIVASSNLTVLITGETGTGKEIVARRVHALSKRSHMPLVGVNCAALPESLAESELFGHVKGAFTSAINTRAGKFELADKGTLFLDEIGELPLGVQAKLLRALQFGEVQRVGADQTKIVDVRVIAATNRDLEKEVAEGRFREDLFHRISVYPLQVPPLRERMTDIELLAGYFLERHRSRLGTLPLRLSEESLRVLRSATWPGNVRELEHVLMRGALRAATHPGQNSWIVIEPEDLNVFSEIPTSAENDLQEATNQFQRRLIQRTLVQTEQNYAEAARLLGVDRSNLHRIARRLGIK